MSNNNKTPAIRFKGFTDAWEQREFNSAFEILQNNTLSRAELCAENGVAGNVHYGDILVKYGEVLDLKTEALPYIQSKEIADKFKASLLRNGDVVIADTAEDETVGKCTEIANLGTFEVLAGLHTIPLRPKQKYAVGYLGYYMNSNSFHDTLLPLMQGTKVTSISKSALQGTTISYPTDYSEQQQIGTYFRNLDNLITLHQRKCDALQKFKKSMLQKMFPQNGESVPEIRFAGFTDAWEQRKWSETVSISTEMVDPRSGLYDDFPHVAPGNIESFTGRVFDNVKTVKEEELISGKFRFRKGDIIYGKINPQLGKYAFAQYDGLTSADAYVLNAYNGVDQKYLFTVLQTKDFYDYSVSVSRRSGMPKINRNELNAYSFTAPNEEEQSKIGEFFLSIDYLITLHQRECFSFDFDRRSAKIAQNTLSWEQRKLGEISESFEYGLNAAATEYDGKHKYIRITDIDDSTHLFIQDNLTSPDIDFSTADDYLLQAGDVLFARTGASVGKTYIYRSSDGDLYFAGFLIRAKIKRDYDADFVFGISFAGD